MARSPRTLPAAAARRAHVHRAARCYGRDGEGPTEVARGREKKLRRVVSIAVK